MYPGSLSFNWSRISGMLSAVPAKTAAIDLREIYDQRIAPLGRRASKRRRTVWQEKFQLFAGTGMLLLVVSSLISEQRPRARSEARG